MKGAGALRRLLNFWPATGVAATIAGAIAILMTGGDNPVAAFTAPIQDRYFDGLLRRRPPQVLDDPAKDPVVIVGYDEKSFLTYGNHLPRAEIAAVLERATAAGAKVTVLDLLLTEKDAGSAKASLALQALEADLAPPPRGLHEKADAVRARFDEDARLASVLASTPTIEAYARSAHREADVPEDYWKRIPESEALDSRNCERAGKRVDAIFDTPIFFQAARVHANAFISPDFDGILRRYPLFSHIGNSDRFYPSIALMAAQIYLDEQSPAVDCFGESISAFSLGARTYSDIVDEQGMVRINYGGSFAQSFPNYIPLVDTLKKNPDGSWLVPDNRFAGKIVFVGQRTDDEDRYSTPFDTTFSGVGFHATVARSLVDGKWLQRKVEYQVSEGGAALALGLLGVLAIVLFPRFATLVVAVGLPFAGYFFSELMLSRGHLVNGLFPGLVATGSMLVAFSSRFFLAQAHADEETERAEAERKQREATQRELGRFLSPAIVDIALRDPGLLAPAKREISILFSDIRGFTTTAEGMSPEALAALLEGYLTGMTQIVFDQKGTLDKYIGDAVMALFGAPVAFEDHPAYACKAALEMMKSLTTMQEHWKATGQPILDIGIGVNTGVVSVGRMGSSGKAEYTCLGDEVNFASRLEGLNKAYGTHILIGETTRAKAGDGFLFRDLGMVQVKGKKKTTPIFELLGERAPGEPLPAWMAIWEKALACFLKREWNEAEALFCEVADARGGDAPSRAFVEFIEIFRNNPPPQNWVGTIERREK